MGDRNYTFDALMQLKDAGAVTASGAAQVGGSARIIDLGANTRIDAQLVIDVSAIATGSADQVYTLVLQGSSSPSFASDIENLAMIDLGNTAARRAGAKTSPIGRYEVGFTNEEADIKFRYLRLFHVIAGTSPSINYTAFAAPEPGR